MVKIRAALAAALVLLTLPAGAAVSMFARAYDLSTPTIGATTNRIVTSVNLTNTSFTIAAQPDVPRNITITVTDTTPSIVAGTITVTGKDVNGNTITETLDLSSALTLTGTKIFASVTSVASSGATVLGGAGDETIIVGVGAVVAPMFCSLANAVSGPGTIKTTGSSTTVVAAAGSPFGKLGPGDVLIVNITPGLPTQRTIVTWTSTTSVVVDSAIDLSANGTDGYNFSYRDLACGTSDTSGWMDSAGGLAGGNGSAGILSARAVHIEVNALTATGGLDYFVQCRGQTAVSGSVNDGTLPTTLVTGNITTVIVPGNATTTFDPILVTEPCASIRVGFKYGTVDTAGTDSITAYLVTR